MLGRFGPSFIAIVIRMIGFVCLFSSIAAHADTEAVRRDTEEAHLKFFEHVFNNRTRDPAELKRLKKEIVAPAQKRLNDSVQADAARESPTRPIGPLISNITDPSKIKAKKDRRQKLIKQLLAERDAIKSGKPMPDDPEAANKAAAKAGGGAPPDTGPARPETVLDGSGIKREIEFGGPSPNVANPAPPPAAGKNLPSFRK